MTAPNPYRPPDAPTADTRAAAPRSARPISAWVLQAMLAIVSLSTLVGLGRMGWMVALDVDRVRAPTLLALSFFWQLAIVLVIVIAMRAIHRARRWARWLGLALIVGLSAAFIFMPDTTNYANDAERAGGQLGKYVVRPLLCIWWAWAFAFTEKAKRYFRPLAVDAP